MFEGILSSSSFIILKSLRSGKLEAFSSSATQSKGMMQLDHLRDELRQTTSSIADIKSTLKIEHEQHRETVQGLKESIERQKLEIRSIEAGTFPSAVETRKELMERESAQKLDMESKRTAIQAEISELKDKLSNEEKIHNYKVIKLEKEIIPALRDERDTLISKNKLELEEIELELRTLTEQYTANKSVLEQLEQRLEEENAKQKLLEQQEATRVEEEKAIKLTEERNHFAALWIQLRWKAYKKRQQAKQATKGKKGKKKKGGKKKK